MIPFYALAIMIQALVVSVACAIGAIGNADWVELLLLAGMAASPVILSAKGLPPHGGQRRPRPQMSHGDAPRVTNPYSGDELAQTVGFMPKTMSKARWEEVVRQLGGRPEKLSVGWSCHCRSSLRVFDARSRDEARRCASSAGWRFAERSGMAQCPACAEKGGDVVFGGRDSDGSNYGPLHLARVRSAPKERWIFVGRPDASALLGRVAHCVGAIARHATMSLSAPGQCGESARVARRLLRVDFEWWSTE